MPCLTISRQLGSLGCQVARLVSERLGFRMVWRELINQAALRCGAPEMALATIDELGLLGFRPSPQARQAYLQAVREVMEELAGQGSAVIVGRAGQVVLHGRADVLHVRVTAPPELRAGRVAAAKGITPEAALAQVEASDRARRAYLRRCYHARWDDPAWYDLVVSTERLSAQQAAELVVTAFTERFSSPETPSPNHPTGIECECD